MAPPRAASMRPVGLSAIPRARLYEVVAAQIRALIWEGHLQPGDRLPAERDLVDRLQVSRSSVREAIRMLELLGLVRCRQGEGTIVREPSADALTVPISAALLRKQGLVEELLEARSMLEPPIAARAALRASPEQVQHLQELLARQYDRLRNGGANAEEDTEFHYAVAIAAGNSVVRKVVDLLIALLRETRPRDVEVPGRKERSYAGHRRVLRAIERHDAAAAERAMNQHLRSIQRVLMRALRARTPNVSTREGEARAVRES